MGSLVSRRGRGDGLQCAPVAPLGQQGRARRGDATIRPVGAHPNGARGARGASRGFLRDGVRLDHEASLSGEESSEESSPSVHRRLRLGENNGDEFHIVPAKPAQARGGVGGAAEVDEPLEVGGGDHHTHRCRQGLRRVLGRPPRHTSQRGEQQQRRRQGAEEEALKSQG